MSESAFRSAPIAPLVRGAEALRDHDFFGWSDLGLRCVGTSTSGQTLGLLRYVNHDALGWQKPGVFEAERTSNPWVKRYGDHCVYIEDSLMPVLAIHPSEATWIRRPQEFESECAEFSRAAGCEVGLSGSFLVGIEQPNSDLDLVLYSDQPLRAGQDLLSSLATHTSSPIPPSSSYQRLFLLGGHSVPRILERNVYTGYVTFRDRRTKVDVLYTQPRPAVLNTVQDVPEATQGFIYEIEVLDDADRFYFPGGLLVTELSGNEFRAVKGDHLLGYLLPGDTATVRGRMLGEDGSSSHRLIVDEVLSVELR